MALRWVTHSPPRPPSHTQTHRPPAQRPKDRRNWQRQPALQVHNSTVITKQPSSRTDLWQPGWEVVFYRQKLPRKKHAWPGIQRSHVQTHPPPHFCCSLPLHWEQAQPQRGSEAFPPGTEPGRHFNPVCWEEIGLGMSEQRPHTWTPLSCLPQENEFVSQFKNY